MKTPKILQLFAILGSTERKAFAARLQTHKRVLLYKLYQLINSSGKEKAFDPPSIFQALYEQPYQTEKSYLLRNEMRLLGNELRAFLAEREWQKVLRRDDYQARFFYLQSIAKRAPFEFFQQECEKTLDQMRTQDEPYWASRIQELYVRIFIREISPNEINYQQLQEQLDSLEQLQGQAFLYQLIETRRLQAFTHKTLSVLQPKTPQRSLLDPPQLDWQKAEQPYLRYKLLLAQSYGEQGVAYVDSLKHALDILPNIKRKSFQRAAEEAKIQAAIALHYFLAGDYAQSIDYHRRMLTHRSKIPNPELAVYLFNFISTLVRVEDYAEALALIDEHTALLLNNERVQDRLLNIQAMCYLLLGQLDEAETCIPGNRKEGGLYNYFYFRIVQSLIYFERQLPDLALTELQNLRHSLHYNERQNSGFRLLIQFLIEYYRLEIDRAVLRDYTQQKQGLHTRIETLDNQQMFQYILPYKWLIRRLEAPT